MTHSFSIVSMKDHLNDPHAIFSVKADRNLLKSVWECSELKVSCWKILHPSDTEDERAVGLTSEDEAEGLEPTPGVSRHSFGGPPAPEAQPELVPAQPRAADDEVVVKKRALKRVKQQVSALLCGEDLPEGAQAREVAEVPYEVPAVPRGETTCPVCRQVFKTHHCIIVHMGVHRGEKFPCGKCGKVLVNRRYLAEHTQVCVQGNRVSCPVCNKQYSSAPSMCKHHGPNMVLIRWFLKVVLFAHFVGSLFRSRRHGGNTSPTVLTTLIIKVLIIAGLQGVRWLAMLSPM